MKQLKIGLIGYAHAHVISNARSFAQLGDKVTFVAGADTVPLTKPIADTPGTRPYLIRLMNEELAIPPEHFYEDYHEMLERHEFDLILVNAENAQHADVCEAILAKNIHVVMEKPLGVTMDDARRMKRAVERSEAEIILNYPSTWWAHVRKAHELVQSGEIGKVLKFTYRNLDSLGPFSYGEDLTDAEKAAEWWYQAEAGGGALLDYCCYGANLASWFLDEAPVSAYGLKGNFMSPFGDVDDYATITVRYPSTVAILEGSWVTKSTGIPHGPIIYGTEGTIVVGFDGTVEVFKTRHHEAPDAIYEGLELEEGRRTLGQEVLHHLETGEPIHPTLDFELNMRAMGILDAGIRSAASGQMELVDTDVYYHS